MNKWPHNVILLTEDIMTQCEPFSKDMWVPHLFWLKVSQNPFSKPICSQSPTWMKLNENNANNKGVHLKIHCVGRGTLWPCTFLCQRLSDLLASKWTWCLEQFNRLYMTTKTTKFTQLLSGHSWFSWLCSFWPLTTPRFREYFWELSHTILIEATPSYSYIWFLLRVSYYTLLGFLRYKNH